MILLHTVHICPPSLMPDVEQVAATAGMVSILCQDFSLPYSNNLSESDLRVYKIKVKVSGGFRSKKGSDYFADALSIVKSNSIYIIIRIYF